MGFGPGHARPRRRRRPCYDGDVPPHAYPGDGIYGITNGSGPYWTGYEINTPLVKEIEQADMLYITPGLLALAELYYTEAQKNINAYTVFTSITCQYSPASITNTEGGVPHAGSGKYENAYQNKIAAIDQSMVLVSSAPKVANPTNALLNAPLQWRTKLTVRYIGYVFAVGWGGKRSDGVNKRWNIL